MLNYGTTDFTGAVTPMIQFDNSLPIAFKRGPATAFDDDSFHSASHEHHLNCVISYTVWRIFYG